MNALLQRKKKQHFVPKFYLQGFTSDDKHERLFMFDKAEMKSFGCNISDIAQKRYFHNINSEFLVSGADPQFVEDTLSTIEGACKPVFVDLIETAAEGGIMDYHKDALSFLIVFQLLRTLEFRERMDSAFKLGSQVWRDFAVEHDCPSIPNLCLLDSYTEEMAPLWHAHLITSIEAQRAFAQPLCDLVWFIAVNETETPYWTSDNPVLHINHLHTGPLWDGLASPGTEIMFPLDQRLLLVLRERTTYFPKEVQRDGRCVRFTTEDVNGHNFNQLVNSTRQTYSPKHDFQAALEACRLYPEIREPLRDMLSN